ncbi:hypothetical protein D9Q98_006923 [Chlorella vulgaris]|uniref:Uncharacterized protein n=1 Tax=Chlorella vulgaris TaxID=3077 RepID=A0A9D4YUG2_CHLVU|nr:hypothetical protein D9Q98_006923 [Chlorella vulgaris]
MGNSHPQPGSWEFAAEFQRIEAAIAAEEAKFELQRNAESLRQLHLRLIDLKIACAKYWSAEIQYFIERHKHAATYGCCLNVGLESQRAVAWRRSQLAFYHRLLALLEEEKSALQQRCPAMEVPLPTLEAVPEALPVGDNICHTCARYMRLIGYEPQLRRGQDGSLQNFTWLPRSVSHHVSNNLGPSTPSAGLGAARQPFTGTGDTAQAAHPMATGAATSTGMADEVHLAAAQAGGGQAAASGAASTGALSAFSAGVDAGASDNPVTTAENEEVPEMSEPGNAVHTVGSKAVPPVLGVLAGHATSLRQPEGHTLRSCD